LSTGSGSANSLRKSQKRQEECASGGRIMKLCVNELTQEAFSEFGKVLGIPDCEPTIGDDVHQAWIGISDTMGIGQSSGKQITALRIHTNPPCFEKMEKHESSAEAFIPLDGQSVLVVAPADASTESGGPDMSCTKAFLMDGSKGVLMKRGTWHALPWKLTDKATFLVLVDDSIISSNDLNITPVEAVEFEMLSGEKQECGGQAQAN
ncbi:MAG: ureidoglycolate lyase, partial [Armatimonadota bacterium]